MDKHVETIFRGSLFRCVIPGIAAGGLNQGTSLAGGDVGVCRGGGTGVLGGGAAGKEKEGEETIEGRKAMKAH